MKWKSASQLRHQAASTRPARTGSASAPARRSLDEGGFLNLHASIGLIVFLAALGFRASSNASAQAPTPAEAAAQRDGQHDFDFHIGTWKTHLWCLLHPLTGSKTWAEYEGTSVVRKVWNGRSSLFQLEVDGPAGHIEGAGLRLYDPQSHQWNLNWASSMEGTMNRPMIGEFKNGRGEFFDQEPFNGRTIFVRNRFSDITATSSRFEQAFSDDGGKTWETNWVMTFTRMKDRIGETN